MRKLLALKAEMMKQNITSLKLSKDLNINSCVFSLYLNGWKKMPGWLMEDIARYLNLTTQELFEGTKGETSNQYYNCS